MSSGRCENLSGANFRVALFTDTYLPTVDGVVNSVLSTKQALEARGHTVFVFAPADPGNGHHTEPRTVFIKAKTFRLYPDYRFAMFPGHEMDQVRELGIDIIHSHGVDFVGFKALLAGWGAKIPMVQTYHTLIEDLLPFYSPIGLNLHLLERALRLYLRVFLHHCAGVVVPSRAILWEILSLAPRARISDVVPTGVDPLRFHPGNDGQFVRDRWELDGHDVLLHVGRIALEKNLPLAINAFALLHEENPDARMLIVGRGPYLPKCIEMARRKGLQDDIVFTGFVPDSELPGYYAAADAFVTASKFETQGLVVLEALASGLPVAGANYRAIPEYVRDGANGALFDPSDVRGCADAMARCLRDGDAMRDAARATALDHSVERSARLLEGVYEEIVGV